MSPEKKDIEIHTPGENRESRHATFECASCGSGTENFSTLFEEGTCSHCGAPAGEVVEISKPEDIEIHTPGGQGEAQPLVRREIIDLGGPNRNEAEEVVERKVIETPSRFGKGA